MRHCEFCGSDLPIHASFCGNCGHLVSDQTQDATALSHSLEQDFRTANSASLTDRENEKDDILLPDMLLPDLLAGQGQIPYVNQVPLVQGTPQPGRVPTVPGTPPITGNPPPSEPGIAHGGAPSGPSHAPTWEAYAPDHHQLAPHPQSGSSPHHHPIQHPQPESPPQHLHHTAPRHAHKPDTSRIGSSAGGATTKIAVGVATKWLIAGLAVAVVVATSGIILVRALGAGNAGSLNVSQPFTEGSHPASLDVNPKTLDFGSVEGGRTVSLSLRLSNQQGSPLTWIASVTGSNTNWLTLQNSNGTIASHGSDTITVTADTSGLAVGSYSATLNIHFNNGDAQIPVALNVVMKPTPTPSPTPTPTPQPVLTPGTWQGQATSDGGSPYPTQLVIDSVNGNTFTGFYGIAGPGNSVEPIQNGQINGNTITFTTPTQVVNEVATYKGTISGNTITGTWSYPGGGGTFTVTK